MKRNLFYLIMLLAFIGCSEDVVDEDMNDQSGIESGTFIDERDNHVYKWVRIGNQIWMAENLAYLPKISDRSTHEGHSEYRIIGYAGNNINEAKSTENYKKYGVLYDEDAAIDACPEGWHVPSNEEWEQLATFISNSNGIYLKRNEFVWESVGKHLKSKTGWNNSGNGNDDFGFNAKPAGRFGSGFEDEGSHSFFWSSSRSDQWRDKIVKILYSTNNDFSSAPRDEGGAGSGSSIRCIKNDENYIEKGDT